jgi:cobalamin-dependent methionine synthase I
MIGERTHVAGSPKVAKLRQGRASTKRPSRSRGQQVESGAQIIDI